MPDERLIQEIEKILSDVVALGGQRERTSIVPNMLVRDASPAGQDDYVIIADNRDNDNILALRVPGVVYADNDLVNVIFPEGGEAIAFQQGSGSTTSGLWDIVTGTDDIYYDKGGVGIGKSVAPDAALEILDTAQQQLRLTFQEDTKFANFTVDTSHNLTIDPSSTGQIKLAAADVTIEEDVIHEGDTDTKISFSTDDVEIFAGNLSMLKLTETTQDVVRLGPGSGDVDINFNGDMFLLGSSGFLGLGSITPTAPIYLEFEAQSAAVELRTFGALGSSFIGQAAGGTKASPSAVAANRLLMRFSGGGYDGTNFSFAQAAMDMVAEENYTAANQGTFIRFRTTSLGSTALATRMTITADGDIGVNGVTSPSTELDIGAGAMEFDEMTAPAAGAVNTARLFAQDNGAGKTQLAVRFNTGAIQILATEP